MCFQNHFKMDDFLEFHSKFPKRLSNFSNNCVANISGWVVKKLVDPHKPVVKCDKCKEALFQESQILAQCTENYLIQTKTRGGLIFPSESVVQISKRTEELLRQAFNKNNCKPIAEKNFSALICNKVLRNICDNTCTLFTSLNNHVFDGAAEELSNHIYTLSKEMCKAYVKLRMYAVTNIASRAAVGLQLRHHINRQIIWKHQ